MKSRRLLVCALSCLGLLAGGAGTARAADPLSVTVTAPPSFTFATNPSVVTANVAGGTAPYTGVQLYVNGLASGPPQSGAAAGAYTFSWDISAVADGTYSITVGATDSAAATVMSPAIQLTVDRTPPLTSITKPSGSGHFQDSLAVEANASDAFGIASVQFLIDGQPSGAAVTAPTAPGGFTYAATLDIASLSPGTHSLTDAATDNAGNTTRSAPVAFAAGPGPSVVLDAPSDGSFATGTTSVVATVSGGAVPYATVGLLVDGAPIVLAPTASANVYTFAWNTTALTDGAHTVAVSVSDANGLTATSGTVSVTVANAKPEATMYAPLPMPSYGYQATNGPTLFQVHASGAHGIRSVQFTVDGTAVGALLTAPDAGQQFLYSITFDTSALAPGMHAVSAVVTDSAGNVSTAAPLEITSGPIVYLPVLNYHGIIGPLDPNPDIFDQTAAGAEAQLAYLQANGYQSVTLAQYEVWLATGALPAGVTKPVLITVDDGLTDEEAWDPLLQAHGFTAVLFEVTGFADNTTPGANPPAENLTWARVQALAANGRWEIAFHAGANGHGDFSNGTTTVGGQSYPSTCWTFFTCLSQAVGTSNLETPAALQEAIRTEISAGLAELKQKIPTANMNAWACPWNACGQWTNQYNDPSGATQAWEPGFLASQFSVVFTQTNPITFGAATGTVQPLDADNRHYRFEVHTDTTIQAFAAALTDPAFAYYPSLTPATPPPVPPPPSGSGGSSGGNAAPAPADLQLPAAGPAPAPLASPRAVASEKAYVTPTRRNVSVRLLVIGRTKVIMRAGKPWLSLTVTRSRPGNLQLVLLDARGRTLARWVRRVTAGRTRLLLPVPVKARHSGRDRLRITSTGTRTFVPVRFP